MPDKSDEAPHYAPTEDGLWEAFFDTDEMLEYVHATDKIHAAQERGEKEVSLPTEFLARVIANKINFDDPEIVAAWNRCCDLVGLPEQKKGEPGGPAPAEMRAHRDVAKMKPITYEPPAKDDEGDTGAGGSF